MALEDEQSFTAHSRLAGGPHRMVSLVAASTPLGIFTQSAEPQAAPEGFNLREWSPEICVSASPQGILIHRQVWEALTHWSEIFPGGSVVRNLTAGQELKERQVQSLNREDPLEEGMATHPSMLSWRNPWTEEAGGLQSIGSQELDTTQST